MNKHNHPEAFKLMIYSCGQHIERIWNSRDGVTPFIVECLQCDEDAKHIDWHLDFYIPEYKPAKGSRIFCDLTEERHKQYVLIRLANVDKEEAAEYGYDSVESFADSIVKEERSHGTPPDVLIVGEEIKVLSGVN